MFSLFNWQQKDILLTINMIAGSGALMYSRTGQKDIDNNIYTAIPMNVNNSFVYQNVSEGQIVQYNITGS